MPRDVSQLQRQLTYNQVSKLEGAVATLQQRGNRPSNGYKAEQMAGDLVSSYCGGSDGYSIFLLCAQTWQQ